MPYARTEHNGQAALWVNNGYICMSKAFARSSKPMGVDNEGTLGKRTTRQLQLQKKKQTQFTFQQSLFWS